MRFVFSHEDKKKIFRQSVSHQKYMKNGQQLFRKFNHYFYPHSSLNVAVEHNLKTGNTLESEEASVHERRSLSDHQQSPISWHIAHCSPLKVIRLFGETCYLYLQSRSINQTKSWHEESNKEEIGPFIILAVVPSHSR